MNQRNQSKSEGPKLEGKPVPSLARPDSSKPKWLQKFLKWQSISRIEPKLPRASQKWIDMLPILLLGHTPSIRGGEKFRQNFRFKNHLKTASLHAMGPQYMEMPAPFMPMRSSRPTFACTEKKEKDVDDDSPGPWCPAVVAATSVRPPVTCPVFRCSWAFHQVSPPSPPGAGDVKMQPMFSV